MASFPNPIFLQEPMAMAKFHSRKLLLHTPPHNSSSPPPLSPHGPSSQPKDPNALDTNVVMVLSVLLCALICSLGLNSIIRCALRCSTYVSTDPSSSESGARSARLANTGVKKKALKTFPTISYAADLKLPGLDTECAICLSEFAPGERVRILPKCNHGFHVRCIDKWLNSHSSCPTCRHCLIETCNKIVGCSQPMAAGTSATAAAEAAARETPPHVVIRIEPLQREDLIMNHEI